MRQRLECHSAFWARARLALPDLRVHGAGVHGLVLNLTGSYPQEEMKARRAGTVDRLQSLRNMIESHIRTDAHSQPGVCHDIAHAAKREGPYTERLIKVVTEVDPIADWRKLVQTAATKDVFLE